MPGEVSGAQPSRAYTKEGGLGIFVNGAPQGVRPNVNFVDTPGMEWSAADDVPNDRVNVTGQFNGEVLLGSASGLDLAGAGSLAPLIAAASLTVGRVGVTRIVVIAENVDTVAVQPQIEVGTADPGGPPYDDVAAAQALALTASGQAQELVLEDPRATVDQTPPTDELTLRRTVAATATAYVVGVRVYGTVVTP